MTTTTSVSGDVHVVTIGFSTSDGIISRAIRAITRAPCSHAWLAYFDATLRARMVMHAVAWGFEVRPWSRWSRRNTLVAEFRPMAAPLDVVRLGQLLGARYDYRAAFLVGLGRLLGRSFRMRDPSKLMCSEAIVRVLQWSGYRVAADLNPEATTPGELMRRCFNSREFALIGGPKETWRKLDERTDPYR